MAFGCGFYILLNQHEEAAKAKDTEHCKGLSELVMEHYGNDANCKIPEAEPEDENVFNSFWKSMVKTSIMFVGEIEFADLFKLFEANSNHVDLKTLTYFFFLSFVVLIVIVLANLLNGLAVSDINEIRSSAEIYTYVSRVETIYLYEFIVVKLFNFVRKNLKKMGCGCPLSLERMMGK